MAFQTFVQDGRVVRFETRITVDEEMLSTAEPFKLSKEESRRIQFLSRGSAKRGEVVTVRKKRTFSASARRKIAAAQRARWARVKAGKRTA